MENITYSVGSIALIDKINAKYDYFNRIFSNVFGKAKNTLPSVKLFINNRLEKCVSVNRLKRVYPKELFVHLNFKEIPSDRSLYREVIRVGRKFQFILERQQRFTKEENLLSDKQFIDFSSSYFEGTSADLSCLGYSRDHRPDKKQITFGISVGINNIPSALTIQKGNVQDKQHFQFMLKTASAVLDEESLLIFDCGANTAKNKQDIRERKFHYLTLKQKQVSPYKKLIQEYLSGEKEEVEINEQVYQCVKVKDGEAVNYIFFSEELKKNQLAIKKRRFEKELGKNKSILNKTKKGKPLAEYQTEEGKVTARGTLEKALAEIENPKITGIEGYFILQSSVDTQPKQILALYKDKDKAEKLIRSIKEGTEIRPIRHWADEAILGYILIIFLTNFLINLTLWEAKNSEVKNVKLLKKYLNNLTLVVLYPPTGFKMEILANISPEIRSILGNYVDKYQNKTWENRW